MFESPGASLATEEPSPAPSVAEPTPPSATPEAAPSEGGTPPSAPEATPSAPATPAASGPAVPPDSSASEWAGAYQHIQATRQQATTEYQQLYGQYETARQSLELAQASLPPDQYAAYAQAMSQRYGHIPGRLQELSQAVQQSQVHEQQLGTAYREWQLRQQFEPLARDKMSRDEEARALQEGQVLPEQRQSFLKGLRLWLEGEYHDARDMKLNVDRYVTQWREQQASTRATNQTDFMGGSGGGAPVDLSKLDADELFRMEATQVRQRRRA